MAKLKKPSRSGKTSSHKTAAPDVQAKAEHMSRSLVESAQQIWMAGVGAFNRAQGEGSKLFEALVKEGMNIEQHTRKLATGRVDAVRDAMEDRVGVVRERATDTWDKLEKVFEERVQRALNRLGVPGREELNGLISRVDALNATLRGKPAAKPARKAAKAPARKAAGKRPSAAKPAKKAKPARKSLPKAPRPVSPRA